MTIRPRFVSSAWYGIYTVEFTRAHVEQSCTTLGAAILQRKLTCVVAYDTRFMSNLFALSAYTSSNSRGPLSSYALARLRYLRCNIRSKPVSAHC